MKRIAIYVYYDKSGIFADYALYFLSELKKVADKIIVIVNGKLQKGEVEKVKIPDVQLYERENEGYDFWAYKEGLLKAGVLFDYEELILCNSSCYGPIYPFQEMFDVMQKKEELDFWGITKHRAEDKNVIKFNSKTKIKEHIQTYFMVFRKKLFLSKEFRNYFKDLKKIKTKKEAIGYFEVNFTEYFNSLGYISDVYVDYDFEVQNPSQYLPDILVKEFRCPLIKKTIFGERFDLAQRNSFGNRSAKLYSYLKQINFDIKPIVDDITRNYSIDEIRTFLHLNYTLSDKTREKFSLYKCALITGNKDFLKGYTKGLEDVLDVIEIKDSITLAKLNEVGKKYEYVLFFFPEINIINSINSDISNEYLYHLANCTIKNRIYLSNVINVFIQNREIGLLSPLPFIFEDFNFNKENLNLSELEKFLKISSIKAQINEKFLDTIPNVFFVRKEVLQKITIDYKAKLNIGALFTLLTHSLGFLSGYISDTETIQRNYDILQYRLLSKKYTLKSQFIEKISEIK